MTGNNEQMKCAECGAPVERTIAKERFKVYGKVYCKQHVADIDAAIENGFVSRGNTEETEEVIKPEPAGDAALVPGKVDADYEIVGDAIGAVQPRIVPELTTQVIRDYICPQATDQEAYMFLQLCLARGLNPFTKEAYLIKYGTSPATMIVGKDAFTQRAEAHSEFDGFEAGIIVMTEEHTITEKDGAFLLDSETLLGGWAKVHRKDRKVPTIARVSMVEYNTKKSSWLKIPSTMIRKVALVQSLREAFPSDLGGCYDASEMGDV